MKRVLPAFAVAFAFANLYLLSLTGPLVSPRHELIYHLPGSATSLFVPVILDLVFLTLALAGLLLVVRRHARAEVALWSALLLLVPLCLIQTIWGFAARVPPAWVSWVADAAALACFASVLLRPTASTRLFRRMRPILTAVLGCVAVSGAILICELLCFGWEARDLNPPFVTRAQRASLTAAPGSERVIWIILDELSYDQVFGHRYPGLALPNFDHLASESTVFTQAVPTAEYTRIAVPSLLTGEALSRTRPSADGRDLYMRSSSGQLSTLRQADTVFGDASRARLFTGAAGWYEPYCRLLPEVLDQCFWTYSDEIPAGLSPGASFSHNLWQPFRYAAEHALSPFGLGPEHPGEGALDVARHRADYVALAAASDRLLQHDGPGVILIHMPIPHPWGFYDRAHGTFSTHRTSYLDNLALADRYLGHVRALLEQQGAWDSADILIMGDHSWRTRTVWANSGFWTSEEQRASHGAFDDRPAFILKLKGQHSPASIGTRFDAVRTRSLIDELIAGRLRTISDLQRWVLSYR